MSAKTLADVRQASWHLVDVVAVVLVHQRRRLSSWSCMRESADTQVLFIYFLPKKKKGGGEGIVNKFISTSQYFAEEPLIQKDNYDALLPIKE